MTAANSENRKWMLGHNHRLEVFEPGSVGNVLVANVAQIAHKRGEEAAIFYNPDLPETESKAVLYLSSGDRVTGNL